MPGKGYACGTSHKEGVMTTDQGPYPAQYPVQLAVEYPDRPLNRLTSFFRIFVIIPIAARHCPEARVKGLRSRVHLGSYATAAQLTGAYRREREHSRMNCN